MISFTLNFLLDLLEEVEVNGLFPSLVGFSDEGFGSAKVVSVLDRDLGLHWGLGRGFHRGLGQGFGRGLLRVYFC